MTISEKTELGKTKLGLIISWSMITLVAVQSTKYISGQLSIDGTQMMVVAVNVAILVAAGYFTASRLGKNFIYRSIIFAVGLFLIAYAAHSPIGNIATAVIACIAIIVYLSRVSKTA